MSFSLELVVEKNHFNRVAPDARVYMQAACVKTCFMIMDTSRALMREPKSGRTYSRRRRVSETLVNAKGKETKIAVSAGRYQASAPGQAPAIDTKKLYNSMRVVTQPDGAAVLVEDDKGVMLELGTKNMGPRPFLGPSADANQQNFYNNIGEAIERASLNHAIGQGAENREVRFGRLSLTSTIDEIVGQIQSE